MTRKRPDRKDYTNNKKQVLSRYYAECVINNLVRMIRFHRNRPKISYRHPMMFYTPTLMQRIRRGKNKNAV